MCLNYRPPSRRTAFFSAVEELDPTLAVVLGRPRLGTNSRRHDYSLLEATVRERIVRINKISAKRTTAPLETRGVPGNMLVL